MCLDNILLHHTTICCSLVSHILRQLCRAYTNSQLTYCRFNCVVHFVLRKQILFELRASHRFSFFIIWGNNVHRIFVVRARRIIWFVAHQSLYTWRTSLLPPAMMRLLWSHTPAMHVHNTDYHPFVIDVVNSFVPCNNRICLHIPIT